jgi:hypothetical protein
MTTYLVGCAEPRSSVSGQPERYGTSAADARAVDTGASPPLTGREEAAAPVPGGGGSCG